MWFPLGDAASLGGLCERVRDGDGRGEKSDRLAWRRCGRDWHSSRYSPYDARAMEFGAFMGASVGPRPWEEREPLRLRRDVEIGIAADRAGYDTFWAPEHHSLEEYSHCSSSHLMCLAVGMKTQRIRVVTGIFNLCPAINHPVRVAEQIAMIDVLTNGRVELGTGRGSGSTEVNTFGYSNEQTRELWDEAIRAIPKMWTQDLFSWQGKHL